MPKISVLLPFYNPGACLQKAVQSIIEQSFSDWEMVLVDNGSTDASASYAKKISSWEPRIRLVEEPQKGIVFALNRGLRSCRAELIARMDADDRSLPERLMLQWKHMQVHHELDLSSGLVRHVSNHPKTEGYRLYVDWINQIKTHEKISLNRFIESPFAHPSVIFRKKAIEKYGSYRSGEFPEDYEMWLRWLERGAKMSKTDHWILDWHDLATRLSRSDGRYSQESFYKAKMPYLDRWLQEHNRFFPRFAVWGAGRYARKRAKYLIEKGHEVLTYIDIDPKKAMRKDCTFYTHIPKAGSMFIVNLAGKRGAGKFVRDFLVALDYTEGRDFVMAAGIS